MKAPKANQIVEAILLQRNKELSKKLSADVILLRAEMRYGVDDAIREYQGLFVDFCAKVRAQDVLHTERGLRRIG